MARALSGDDPFDETTMVDDHDHDHGHDDDADQAAGQPDRLEKESQPV
ncbi:hypothetical protein [Nocardioides sp. J9]|nr:hypothetical protein [Nocardioides sp. J9]